MIIGFKTKYRIIQKQNLYYIQYKFWWLPIWITLTDILDDPIYFTLASEAELFYKNKLKTKFPTKVIKELQ